MSHNQDMSDEPESELDAAEAKLEELMGKVKDAAKVGMPYIDHDDDMKSRLEGITERGRSGQQIYKEKVHDSHSDSTKGVGLGFAVAYNLLGAVIGGLIVGWILQATTHQALYLGLGGGLGAAIGMASVLMLLLRKKS